MMRGGIWGIVLVSGTAAISACSSDGGNTAVASGGTAQAGGAGGTDSAGGTGGVAGSDGSGAGTGGGTSGNGGSSSGGASGGSGGSNPAPMFESNPPGSDLDLTVTGPVPGLVVLNSNINQDTELTPYTQWFAEVRNDGTALACYVRAFVRMYDAADTLLWNNGTLGAFADTEPYDNPDSTSVVPCLAPGETGPLYSNEFDGVVIDIPAIARIEIDLESTEVPGAVLHPDRPVTSNVTLTPGSFSTTLSGDVTAVADMELVSVNVYARDASLGLYGLWSSIGNGVDPVFADSTWHFEGNSTTPGTFTDPVTFVMWTEPEILARVQLGTRRPPAGESLAHLGLQQVHRQYLERIREGQRAYVLARAR